jgi:PAS domain S-box-containing protein
VIPADNPDVAARVLGGETRVECLVAGRGLSGQAVLDLLEARRSVDERLPFLLIEPRADDGQRQLLSDPYADCIDLDGTGDAELIMARVRTLVSYLRTKEELRMKDRGLDQAPVGITISDPTRPDNPLVYVSDGFERLTGYDAEWVLGKNCRFLQGKETDPETVATVREAVEQRQPVGVDILNYRKDGTEFWNHLEVAPIYEDGELVNFVGYQRDITQRKEAELALARQNDRLETLAGVLGHDLRNPLQVAFGLLEGVEDERIDEVQASLERIEEIVEDALTLIRTNSVESPETVDLSERAEAAWEQVRTADARLVVADDARFLADPGLLSSVLENLFRNAVVHGGADTVTVGGLSKGFYVADDGSGIPADDQERVFEHGYTTDEDGTGLGLSIVAEIAAGHGWTVEAVAGEDGGAPDERNESGTRQHDGTGGARFEFRGVSRE